MAKLLRAALAALSAGEGKYALDRAEPIKTECLHCVTKVLQLELAAYTAGKPSGKFNARFFVVPWPQSPSVVRNADVITMFPLLGNLLAVLLDGAVAERHKSIRVACLQAIDATLFALSGRDPDSASVISQELTVPCPWRLSKLFPGTIAALIRVSLGDFKQGSKVTAASVTALRTALNACVNDEILMATGLLQPSRPRSVQELLRP
jgi:hypothetical protein